MKSKLLALIMIPFLFMACSKTEVSNIDKNNENIESLKATKVYEPCGTPLVATLTDADETVIVGTVTVGNDENTLYVNYELTGDNR